MERLLKGQVARLPDRNVRNDNFLQRLLLTWVYAVVAAGRRGALRQDDLRMPRDQAVEAASERFLKEWRKEAALLGDGVTGAAAAGAAVAAPHAAAAAAAPPPKQQQPSLARALWRAFGREFALAGAFKLLWSSFVLLGASYFVNALIEFVQGKMAAPGGLPGKGVGWVLSAGFFADSWLAGLALQRMGDVAVRVGIKARAALITALYRKSFRLNSAHGHGAGNVVSLVSTDCVKVYEGVQHCHNVWTAPLEAATIIGLLLWRTGGAYGLPALGVVLVVLPLQYVLGYRIAAFKAENAHVSDARVLRMHEILLAIKLVKFYAWERSFARQVEAVRAEELRLIRATGRVKTANLCLVFAVPPVVALVIYATYARAVGPLTPAMAFVVLSLFNTLRFPLVVLPKALRGVSEAVAALNRIQQFLLLPESEEAPAAAADGSARIVDAELHYGSPEDFTLAVPRFSVAKGEVVAIVGRVGSGKSSVLQALLSKMTAARGAVAVTGGPVAYVPQSPWVQNLSLRDNITFGLPYDAAKYRAVVHACALELDLRILPQGDATLAGERGINLSGGQRQRLALARAAYHDADLVLLDNPLSAVDQHTSKHIFERAIRGLLRDRAVVLVAHQLELLPMCTRVAVMRGGAMAYFGPYDAAALAEHGAVDALADATVEAKEAAAGADDPGGAEAPASTALVAAAKADSGGHGSGSGSSLDGAARGGGGRGGGGSLPRADRSDGSLIKAGRGPLDGDGDEDEACRETPEQVAKQFSGTAPRVTAGEAALVYWRAGGRLLAVASVTIFAVTQTTRIIGDWWIRSWAADAPAHFYARFPRFEATGLYLAVYGALVALFTGMLLTRDSVFNVWAIRASTTLHNRLFRRVLAAPALFFLRTPAGDVLNAFARDQDALDEALPDTLHMTGIYLMILLTSLAIVTVSIHYYAAMAGALLAAFALMQFLYLPAATTLKRWAGETASAAFVHVDESLHGADVVRAFGAVEHFAQEAVARLNRHHLALFNTEQAHLWLAFWCDFFGAGLVVATALMAVAFSEQLGGANVGLAISNSIQVLVFFTWVVRGVADAVSMWDAVERVATYATRVPSELTAEEQSAEDAAAAAEEQGDHHHHHWRHGGGHGGGAGGAIAHRHARRMHSSQRAALAAGRVRSSLDSGGGVSRAATRRASREASVHGPGSVPASPRRANNRGASLELTAAAAALGNDTPWHRKAAAAVRSGLFFSGSGSGGGATPRLISASDELRIVVADKNAAAAAAAAGGAVGGPLQPPAGSAAAAAVPPGWPATGDLRFEGVSLRYFPGGPLALKGVTLHVRDREKVGIVGRTGSGKTTLLMALFRLLEPARGRVLVDGLDIATLPLKEVRRRVSIIPQEPVMFKGTVRSNLDPFGEASDNDLWHALALVHLRDAVADMPGGLDAPVAEGGANFSLGRKQLVCMARCVLRPSRVLVLDEATAACDLATDALIQATVRKVFADCTTLTIAHRLNTIMDSDRVLAMDRGRVREFDAPSALLRDPSSMFARLVDDTGPAASAALRAMVAGGSGARSSGGGGGSEA